jgi:5-methylcytosine-specific restriction endonuclease McrA
MPASRFELAHATLWKKQRPTFDHIRPKSAGGSDAPQNLQLAHAACNWRKGSEILRARGDALLQPGTQAE